MKQKIIIKDGNKTITGEVALRNIDHLTACIKYPSHTFTPKKGKGSYKRKQKYNTVED